MLVALEADFLAGVGDLRLLLPILLHLLTLCRRRSSGFLWKHFAAEIHVFRATGFAERLQLLALVVAQVVQRERLLDEGRGRSGILEDARVRMLVEGKLKRRLLFFAKRSDRARPRGAHDRGSLGLQFGLPRLDRQHFHAKLLPLDHVRFLLILAGEHGHAAHAHFIHFAILVDALGQRSQLILDERIDLHGQRLSHLGLFFRRELRRIQHGDDVHQRLRRAHGGVGSTEHSRVTFQAFKDALQLGHLKDRRRLLAQH